MLRLPQLIKNSLRSRFRVFDTFPVSLVICLIGFLAHFSFIFLFDYWGVPSLSYFNVFSSWLWAWAIAEILRGYTYRSVYLGTIEILLHAVFAMSILGQDSGFDLYLWPLVAWLAYYPNINHKFALVAGSASIILWVFGRVYRSHIEDVPVSVETLDMMLRVNAVIAGVAFIFGIVSARILVERHSKKSFALHLQNSVRKEDLVCRWAAKSSSLFFQYAPLRMRLRRLKAFEEKSPIRAPSMAGYSQYI